MPVRVLNTNVPAPELVDTEEQAQDFLCLCLKKIEREPSDFIGFDTETTGKKIPITVGNSKPLDWMSDTVTFWSLSFKVNGQYRRWCIRGEHFQYFAPVLENPRANFACWNAKYDAHVSWNMGINIWNANIFDGLALAGLHDENRMSQGLKSCAPDWMGLQMTSYHDLFGTTDANGKKIKEYETDLRDLDITLVSDYASNDAYAHLVLVEWLMARLSDTPINKMGYSMWQYFLDFEKDITKILWRIERRGMPVDRAYLQAQIPVIEGEIKSCLREVAKASGKPDADWIRSPQKLAKFFFDPVDRGGLGLTPVKMTASGRTPSVDAEVLELLQETGTDLIKAIMRSRTLYKTKSTYIDTLKDLSDYFPDHRIHPNFHQFGARTGRFSTDVPNSQNFPRPDNDEFGIRKIFAAPPGCVLIVADYEQLEMRIMAHVSGDPEMIGAIKEGKDLHSFTVSRMVPGVTYEEVVAAKKSKEPTEHQKWLKRCRQDMKAVGFGILYGAGPAKVAEQIEIPEEEVATRLGELLKDTRHFNKLVNRKLKNNPLLLKEKAQRLCAKESIAADKIQAYFRTFPMVERYIKSIPEECRQSMKVDFWQRPRDWSIEARIPGANFSTKSGHGKPFGFVQTLLGRYRRLENIDHPTWKLRGDAERQAVNSTIQGSASDIIKGAMRRIEFSPLLNSLRAEMVNQVHDELVITCPIENADVASAEVRECMEHPWDRGVEAVDVPLPVDLKQVQRWADAKE
jgi:DNA polymerase I